MAGSTMRPGGLRTLNVASVSVMTCAAVNMLTMKANCLRLAPSSKTPTRKSMCSGPNAMCRAPEPTNLRTTAQTP